MMKHNNIYHVENNTKTTNTLRKTIILGRKSKYDSLDYNILAETITARTKKYNKIEFKKLKYKFYNLKFYTNIKEKDNNIIFNLTFEFIDLKFTEDKKEMLKELNFILEDLGLFKEDLEIVVNNYKTYFKQLMDNQEKYIKYVLKYEMYGEEILSLDKSIKYLKELTYEKFKEKGLIQILNSTNYYYVFEGSKDSFESMNNLLKLNNNEIIIKDKKQKHISKENLKIENIKNQNQVSIAMVFQSEEDLTKDEFKLKLLNSILGRGTSSLLFKNVREKHSLCYSIYSQENLDYGIEVYTGVSIQNKEFAIKSIKEEFDKIKNGEIEEEFIISKKQYISDLKQEEKKIQFKLFLLEENIIKKTNKYELDKIISEIEKITLNDISEFSKKFELKKEIIYN